MNWSEKPQGPSRTGSRQEPNPWTLVGVGIEFAGVVALLALGGWWLDGRWGTSPWLMLVGLIIGLIGGVYNLWKTGKRFF